MAEHAPAPAGRRIALIAHDNNQAALTVAPAG